MANRRNTTPQGLTVVPIISPLIYSNCGTLRRSHTCRHIHVNGVHISGGHGAEDKISQYADDSTLTLIDDPSIIRAFNILEKYQAGSGSKLNLDKTEATYLGRTAGKTHSPVPIKWGYGNLTILGIQIGPQLHAQNWIEHLGKFRQRLKL